MTMTMTTTMNTFFERQTVFYTVGRAAQACCEAHLQQTAQKPSPILEEDDEAQKALPEHKMVETISNRQ